MATRITKASILCCSKGIVHPTLWARKSLNDILLSVGDCTVYTTSSIKFRRLIDKHHPDLIVLYFHEKTAHPDDLSALDDYVTNGGAILAIHSASASFKQEASFHQLLGGRFVNHGPIYTYTIQPSDYTKKLFCTLAINFSIKDELYIHNYSDEVHVLLETQLDDQKEPIAWIKNHNLGKVAYFAPGHRGSVFKLDRVQETISQLIEWSLTHE